MTQIFTREDVSKHNTTNDAWLIIHNEVYDVSKFHADHPGGADVLLDLVGSDASDGFEANNHSADAKKVLASLKIGALGSTKSTQVFRLSEIASSKTAKKCLIAINNKVFDVTQFLDKHPGGRDLLLYNGGLDASQAFLDAGHDKSVHRMMEEFYVGELHPKDQKPIPTKKTFEAASTTQSVAQGKPATAHVETSHALREFIATQTKVIAIVVVAIAVFIYILL